MSSNGLTADLVVAERFLTLLTDGAPITFQTFADSSDGRHLARILHGTPPPLATSPWTALLWARRQLQQGQEQAARNTTARGLADLQWLAEHQVPPAFSESFLQRHPAHRALQALGARLRAGGLLSAGP